MKNLLRLISDIVEAHGNRVYIVGGWLRDRLLGRLPGDVDLVVEVPAMPGPNWTEVAHRFNGRLVILDERRGLYRLVVPLAGCKIQVDIDVVDGDTITENLKQRDFTINALAMPLSYYLSGEFKKEHVIDPLGGLDDLRAGLIRICRPDAINNDPLRALRAFRLAARLEFSVEPRTMDLIRHAGRFVTDCSGERVWDEFSAILEMRAAPVVRRMDGEVGLLEQILPEIKPLKELAQGGYHVDYAWEHSLKTLEQFELLWQSRDMIGRLLRSDTWDNSFHSEPNNCAEPSNEKYGGMLPGELYHKITGYLNGYITRLRTRVPVFKLACLLHDVGKQFTCRYAGNGKYTFYGHHQAGVPVARAVAEKLKMSGREKDVLAMLVGGHMDPLFLYKAVPPTPVAVRRFFKRAGQEAPGLLMLSLADIRSSRLAAGREEEAGAYAVFIRNMLQKYYNAHDIIAHPPGLLDGHEVCVLLGIKPSPMIRRVLESLADAQVEGKIKTKAEAEAFVLRMGSTTT